MTDERNLDELTRMARELPQAIKPKRDLWPDIATRISQDAHHESEAHRFELPWWRQLAAAAVLVALSSLMTLWLVKENTYPPAGVLNGHGPGEMFALVRADLSRDFEQHIQTLPPETRVIVEKNLADIRRGLAEIEEALRNDPGNVTLQQLVVTAYEQELNYLADMSQMSELVPGRTDI